MFSASKFTVVLSAATLVALSQTVSVDARSVDTSKLHDRPDVIVIATTNEDHTVNCHGGHRLSIRGINNNISARNCDSIAISGTNNNLSANLGAGGAVNVSGTNNDLDLTYGANGSLSISGNTNEVEITRLNGANISIADSGTGNGIDR